MLQGSDITIDYDYRLDFKNILNIWFLCLSTSGSNNVRKRLQIQEKPNNADNKSIFEIATKTPEVGVNLVQSQYRHQNNVNWTTFSGDFVDNFQSGFVSCVQDWFCALKSPLGISFWKLEGRSQTKLVIYPEYFEPF